MLAIMSATPSQIGENRCRRLSSSWAGWTTKIAMYVGFATDTSSTRRSPFDYLKQGSVFDKFGNKQVKNFQVNGELIAVPTINGRDYGTSLILPQWGVTSYRERSAIPVDPNGYAILNYGDMREFGVQVTSGQWNITARAFLGVESAGKVGYAQAWLECTANRTTGKVRTAKVHYQGNPGSISGKVEVYVPDLGALPSLEAAVETAKSMEGIVFAYAGVAQTEVATYLLSHSQGTTTRVNISSWINPQVDLHTLDYAIWLESAHVRSAGLTRSECSVLARRAIEGLNAFDSNLLAYTGDLRKTGDTIREIVKLSKNLTSKKAWASAWLSGRYGDRLAVSDTRELLEAVAKQLARTQNTSTGRARTIVSRTHYGLDVTIEQLDVLYAYNDSYNGLMTAIYNLMRWDAWPTLENTWDMIPLSFLVDWALPVSDLLGQIDAAVEAPYIRASSQYVGVKVTAELPQHYLTDHHLSGSVRMVYYHRAPHSVLGDVRPFDVVADLPSLSVVHTVDALALVTTMRRHR